MCACRRWKYLWRRGLAVSDLKASWGPGAPSSSFVSGLSCLSCLAARGAAFAVASFVYAVAKGCVPQGLCMHGDGRDLRWREGFGAGVLECTSRLAHGISMSRETRFRLLLRCGPSTQIFPPLTLFGSLCSVSCLSIVILWNTE